MSLGIRAEDVFSLRLANRPMPTGSKDAAVLLDWILESMCLVRRRPDQSGGVGQEGALHRIFNEAILTDPLRGWDSKQIGNHTGLSNTGIHHQMVKLRDCGLVASQLDGKWHRHVLRGGSMSAATSIVEAQAISILELRLSELAQMVERSDTRMNVEAEESPDSFSIRISEPGPRSEDADPSMELVHDLGLAGEGRRAGRELTRNLLVELCSSHHPVTLMALSERLSESRGKVSTAIDRMRSAGLVERAPMVDRIPQDIFAGLVRQFDARGEEWLISRGGLGRLEESVSMALIGGASKASLDIEGVREILSQVPLEDQRILLNLLGGRMPYGFRMSGADGASVSNRVMRNAERTLRRIRTVAARLDDCIARD